MQMKLSLQDYFQVKAVGVMSPMQCHQGNGVRNWGVLKLAVVEVVERKDQKGIFVMLTLLLQSVICVVYEEWFKQFSALSMKQLSER